MDFAVTMSRAASETVTVDYATADGSATAGDDYTAASGTLTFSAGETAKTVSVPVLPDAIDDSGETFTLALSNVSGGDAWLADATATGTIENDGPMPQAWLARFGRTVASQAVDAIAGRMEAGGGSSQVTVGGQSLSLSGEAMTAAEREEMEGALQALAGSGEADGDPASRSLTARELVLGSSFRLSAGGGEAGGPAFTAWGQLASGGFEAEVDETRLDGDVTSGFLGVDVGRAGWLAGLALGLSEGEGSYASVDGADRGAVESSLTAFYPYARVALNDRLDVWGLAGFGGGELTLMQNPGTARAKTYETDISMRMGALGARGEVVSPASPGGLSVALKSDAFWVETSSEAVDGPAGRLGASDADASRVRLLVEGAQSFATGAGTLTPALEFGLRHDGGDAETGTGFEAGASFGYAGAGFSVEAALRTLVAHEEAGYEEWGASGALRIDPGASGRGLSLSVAPSWGAAETGTARLWSAPDAQGLAPEGAFEAGRRVDAELAYGFALPSAPGVLTPYAGLSLGDGEGRAWRGGARWQVTPQATLSFEGIVREAANDDTPPALGAMLRAALHW